MFIVNFEHILRLNIVFSLLTLKTYSLRFSVIYVIVLFSHFEFCYNQYFHE